jgi:myo-inositol 2-dehydrogenase / D-chiro-inositol 1-dehydrogenase
MRVGIIGAGWIARRHVPAIDAADGVELIAACDSEPARAEAIAAPRGARAYTRWEEMLDREPLDAVWVCTPPLAHREPTVAALQAGLHVYLEKPIARTLDDAQAIAEAAAASVAVCAVGYQWHALELLDQVRDAVAGQSVGMLVGRNYGPTTARPWFTDRRQGGGQILERGSHHIDLQRAIAGEIDAVQAASGSVRMAQAEASGGDIEDALALVLHFRTGAVGVVNVTWARDGQPGLYSLDVLADNASLWLELGSGRYRLSGVASSRDYEAEAAQDPFERSILRFLDAAREGDHAHVFCAPDDALRTLAVALACERALADGGTVPVSLA